MFRARKKSAKPYTLFKPLDQCCSAGAGDTWSRIILVKPEPDSAWLQTLMSNIGRFFKMSKTVKVSNLSNPHLQSFQSQQIKREDSP
jgi:hypothetical protein